jgi:hypothetical protein
VRPETYSVVVNNVRVQELLFALARDARLNVDIHPDMTGSVTLNAIDRRCHACSQFCPHASSSDLGAGRWPQHTRKQCVRRRSDD